MKLVVLACSLLLIWWLGPPAPRPPAEQLNGFVMARNGQPIAGASIWQKDQPSNTTSSNSEGQFILPKPPEASFVLRVDAYGYVQRDQLVTDTTTLPLRIKLVPLVSRRR